MIKLLDLMLEDLSGSEYPLILPCTAELVDVTRSWFHAYSFFIVFWSIWHHSQPAHDPCYRAVSLSWLTTELYSKPYGNTEIKVPSGWYEQVYREKGGRDCNGMPPYLNLETHTAQTTWLIYLNTWSWQSRDLCTPGLDERKPKENFWEPLASGYFINN